MEKRKRLNPNADNMEMQTLKQQMQEVQDSQEEILLILKGNVEADMTGLVQRFAELADSFQKAVSEVAHLMRFKKRIEETMQLERQREQAERDREQRRREERTGKVLTIVFGSIGTAVLIVEFILKVVEQMKK